MYRLRLWTLGTATLIVVLAILTAPWTGNCSVISTASEENSLVLLHVLLRHGDRSPDLSEVYPNDPYAAGGFNTTGYGQLTKEGKRREYLIGRSLREKYNQFLGLYAPNSVEAASTDYVRTEMSCLLVLAGLYPPSKEELWDNNIQWQPIPCDSVPYNENRVLGDPLKHCEPFKAIYKSFLSSEEGQAFYYKNKEVYDYLSQNTGWNIKSPKLIYDLSFLLNSEEIMGLELPTWTKNLWPDNITVLGADEYFAQASSLKADRIAAGYFLQKILNDTERKLNSQLPDNRKIFIYSAHEYNIAFLLKVLGVFEPHIPPYGSYVTFEVHKIDGVNGFKILYQDYKASLTEPKVLKLPECDVFCPLEKFKQLVNKYIPEPNEC